MTALDHITAGRTVFRALLIAIVLIAGLVGTGGTAAAEPMDGKGNDPYPAGVYLSLDGKGNDPFHLSLTSGSWTDVIDDTGTDVRSDGFSVEAFGDDYVGRGGGSGKASL